MNAGTKDESPSKENAMALNTATTNGSLEEASSESYYIDPVKEHKMMRKFDVCDLEMACPPSAVQTCAFLLTKHICVHSYTL
jgi:hypothetical protein